MGLIRLLHIQANGAPLVGLNAGEKLLEVVDETGAQDYLRITGLEAVNHQFKCHNWNPPTNRILRTETGLGALG